MNIGFCGSCALDVATLAALQELFLGAIITYNQSNQLHWLRLADSSASALSVIITIGFYT